jgi:hypothetical protein
MINLDYQNSYYMDDTDSVILDAYIYIYTGQTPSALTDTWTVGNISMQRFDNMLVKVASATLTNFAMDMQNYYWNGSNALDGTTVPTWLRLSGTLNGVDTTKTQKI